MSGLNNSSVWMMSRWALVSIAVSVSSTNGVIAQGTSFPTSPAPKADSQGVKKTTIKKVPVRRITLSGRANVFARMSLAVEPGKDAAKQIGTVGLLDTLGKPADVLVVFPRSAPIGNAVEFPVEDRTSSHMFSHDRLMAALQQTTTIDLSAASPNVIQSQVMRAKNRLEEDNITLFVPTEYGLVAVTNLAMFQADADFAKATSDAFERLLKADPSLGSGPAMRAYGISMGYIYTDPEIKKIDPRRIDRRTGGHSDPYINTDSIIWSNSKSFMAYAASASNRFHEQAHKLWRDNDIKYGPVDAVTRVQKRISSKIVSKIDYFALQAANEANAISRTMAADLIADVEILSNPKHPAYKAAKQRVANQLYAYGGFLEITRDLAAKGLTGGDHYERAKQASLDDLIKHVAVHKDIPASIRTEMFLEKLRSLSDLHVDTYFNYSDNRTFTGSRITISADDLVNLTRNVDGVSYLEDYVKANPKFILQIEQLPWAQTLQYPPQEQRTLMQQARKYGDIFDPKAAQGGDAAKMLWDYNNIKYGAVDTATGIKKTISSRIASKMDYFAVSIARQANATATQMVAELLADVAKLSDPKHPDYEETENRVVNLLHNYGGLMDKVRELVAKGQTTNIDFQSLRSQALDEFKKYVATHKDIPLSMRAEMFLKELKSPSHDDVKSYFDGLKDQRLTGAEFTLSADDLIHLTRNVDGVSYLADYVAGNPNFMKQIEQYPWAQTLSYTVEQQRELMQLAGRYGMQFDPNEAQNIAETQVLYEKAIAANFSGAVDAFKKMMGVIGNDLTGGGGGGDGDNENGPFSVFSEIKNPKQRDIISFIMYGVSADALQERRTQITIAAVKEMMIRLAASTHNSKVENEPFTATNIEALANLIEGKQADLVTFIKIHAPAGVDIGTLTYRVMDGVRQEKIATLISVYTNMQFDKDSQTVGFRISGLKWQVKNAKSSDAFFRKEIVQGKRRDIDLRMFDPTGKRTNDQMFADLEEQHAKMKAAEEAKIPKLLIPPRPAKRPTASAPSSAPSGGGN